MYQSAGTEGVEDAAAEVVSAAVVDVDHAVVREGSGAAVAVIACVGADATSVVLAAAHPPGSEVAAAVAVGVVVLDVVVLDRER